MKNKKILENTDGNKKSGIFYSKRWEGMGGGGVEDFWGGQLGFRGTRGGLVVATRVAENGF